MQPVFLSLDEILEIHEQQIERYGGAPGLRDIAGLESAVATPQATFDGEFLHRSIPAMAAAYLFHLCQNQAFIDGNKRTGANAAITFLFMNGWDLALDEEEVVSLVLSVVSGQLDKSELTGAFETATGSYPPKKKSANKAQSKQTPRRSP